MTTAMKLAAEMSRSFERKTRDNGDVYVTLKADAPDWMTDVCHRAHGDMMPDDFRYAMIESACDAFADMEDIDDEDDTFERIDSAVPVYNSDRLRWVASHLHRAYYVNEAVTEYGFSGEFDLLNALGLGYYAECREVFNLVREALKEFEDAEEDADDE